MASKDSESGVPSRGFGDVIGICLLTGAVLLFAAQVSFDRADVAANRVGPPIPMHNWIGGFGANLANGFFFLFGVAAFVMPILLAFFGLGYLLQLLSYLKHRWWAALMLLAASIGLLDLYTSHFRALQTSLNAPSAGGLVGMMMNTGVFKHFGTPGATILFVVIYMVGMVFLTNFQLGEWMRNRMNREIDDAKLTPEERDLERRKRDLERQAARLQEQVEKKEKDKEKARGKAKDYVEKPVAAKGSPAPVGIGQDLQPVPEPTVRDLSVPQSQTGKAGKSKPAPVVAEIDDKVLLEGEVITANEVQSATAGSSQAILGRSFGDKVPEPAGKKGAAAKAAANADPSAKTGEAGAEAPPWDVPATEGAVPATADAALPAMPVDNAHFIDNSGSKPRRLVKKPKPIAVASTPKIGNYQLPPMDLLNHPDLSIKPTETKEELMANARLMKETLAQFDIEVALGDITKGPTITRYELHPAPGVKLEKITALSNNIAAALKAERINILAPIPGKSSVGVEVPNAVKTKVIMRDLLESEEWQNSKGPASHRARQGRLRASHRG